MHVVFLFVRFVQLLSYHFLELFELIRGMVRWRHIPIEIYLMKNIRDSFIRDKSYLLCVKGAEE